MSVRLVILTLAFVCFFMAAIEVRVQRLELKALGLALWVLAEMIHI